MLTYDDEQHQKAQQQREDWDRGNRNDARRAAYVAPVETGEETECRGCSDIDVCDEDTGLCPRCVRALEDRDEGFETSECLTDRERNPTLR